MPTCYVKWKNNNNSILKRLFVHALNCLCNSFDFLLKSQTFFYLIYGGSLLDVCLKRERLLQFHERFCNFGKEITFWFERESAPEIFYSVIRICSFLLHIRIQFFWYLWDFERDCHAVNEVFDLEFTNLTLDWKSKFTDSKVLKLWANILKLSRNEVHTAPFIGKCIFREYSL